MYRLKLNAASQAELYLQARDRMAQLLPGWSDTSLSDPAVALLELFSYLSEVQNRRIDTLQDECYLAFLRLLSLPPRQLACARLLAEADGPLLPWPGMRFLVDGVPFEAVNVPSPECRRTVQAALVRGGTPCFLREDVPCPRPPGHPWSWRLRLTLRSLPKPPSPSGWSFSRRRAASRRRRPHRPLSGSSLRYGQGTPGWMSPAVTAPAVC